MRYAIAIPFEIEAENVFEASRIANALTKPCTLDYRCHVDAVRPSDCVPLDEEDCDDEWGDPEIWPWA